MLYYQFLKNSTVPLTKNSLRPASLLYSLSAKMPASIIMVTVDINNFLIRNMEGALTSTSLCTVVKHTSDFLSV